MGARRHRDEVRAAAVPYAVREGRPVRAVAEECGIATHEDPCHLAVMQDGCTRRVAVWSVTRQQTARPMLGAMQSAWLRRRPCAEPGALGSRKPAHLGRLSGGPCQTRLPAGSGAALTTQLPNPCSPMRTGGAEGDPRQRRGSSPTPVELP